MYNQYDKTGQINKRTSTTVHGTPKPVWSTKGAPVPCHLGEPSITKMVLGDKVTFVETRPLYTIWEAGLDNGDKITIDGLTYDIISAHQVETHHTEATVKKCQ